jgi:hypothetical protein
METFDLSTSIIRECARLRGFAAGKVRHCVELLHGITSAGFVEK